MSKYTVSIKSPFTEEELKSIQTKARDFAVLCYRDDSLNRGIAWSTLVSTIHQIIIEETKHNYEFPSIHNPVKG